MRIVHHVVQLMNCHVTRHSARDLAGGDEWAGCEELSMICQFYIESQKMTIIDNLHRPTKIEGEVRQARRLSLLHSTASHVVPVLTFRSFSLFSWFYLFKGWQNHLRDIKCDHNIRVEKNDLVLRKK